MENNSIKVRPFLKWAGGKRWLVYNHSSLFPSKFNTYIEPFLGSGAVYFHLKPKKAILSDLNKDLIEVYQAIKQYPGKIERKLEEHHKNHSKEYYYQIRGTAPEDLFERAAKFIYLNRTCWNGLYRVNLKGQFNVPIGTKQNVVLDTDDFQSVSKILAGAQLFNEDFESIIDKAVEGDFVFVDPPYTVKHNLNGFIKYNENLFSWEDQERLKSSIDRAVDRGAKVLLLNAAHGSIKKLYKGYGYEELSRKNVLSGKPEYRGAFSELAVFSW